MLLMSVSEFLTTAFHLTSTLTPLNPSTSYIRTYTVEFARKNLKHNQRKRELAQTRSNVRSLESPLSGADFNEFLG